MSEQSEPKRKKPSILPKMEVMIIFVFFLSFIIWAVSKCQSTSEHLQKQDVAVVTTPEVEVPVKNISPKMVVPEQRTETSATSKAFTKLFVTMDGLNMRTMPHLDSSVVAQLSLYEEVYFLNEVTDFKQTINLGLEEVTEPWIKVKTRKGHSGWVFGAGVNYYKIKHPSVLE